MAPERPPSPEAEIAALARNLVALLERLEAPGDIPELNELAVRLRGVVGKKAPPGGGADANGSFGRSPGWHHVVNVSPGG